MRERKVKILIVLIVLLAIFSAPITTYASETDTIENEIDESNNNRFGGTSPWLSGSQDNSIYGNIIDAGEEDQDISAEKPGRVEKYIAELFRNIGSALISVLQDNIGASIDTIVYGRVGSGQPNKVNIYAFELRKGNPYGVTASVCYALLRSMMFIFLGIYFVFQLAKAAWSGQTAKSRDEIKSIIPTLMVKFSALILMPHLLDVALYVRDVLLYGIKEVTGQMITGGATLSLSKAFLLNAERSGTVVDAVMYLGTVVLTIYFVFLYVAVAIDMLVCFVSFPFICVLHSKKKDLVGSWIMTVFSNLMTPVIDAVLLLIPLLTSLMLSDVVKGVSIIQLVMCMLIVPARVRFKALLGIQSNERNGFLGAMAVMTLARALAGRIKQGAGKIADAVSDAKKSSMHGELAEVDREEEQALLSGDGSRKNGNLAQDVDKGIPNGDSGHSESGENKGHTMENTPAGGMGIPAAGERGISETAEEENTHGGTDTGTFPAMEGVREAVLSGITAGSVNEAIRGIDRQMENSQSRLDGLRMERAKLVQKDKRLRRQMLDCRRGSDEYRSLERERADMEEQTAQMDSQIAAESGRLNRLRGQAKDLHAVAGMRNTPTEFTDRRADILRKRANISNFEQPEFQDVLTNEQMRDLYRKRAIANTAKTVTGTAGAVTVGMAAGSAAVYLGGSGAAMAAAGGMYAGGAAGEAAVDISAEIGRKAAPAVRMAGRNAYQAADMAASAYLMHRICPAAMQIPVDYTGQAAGIVPGTVGDGEEGYQEDLPNVNIGTDRIAVDAGNAIQGVITFQGSPKNSAALRAMQQATLQLEREIAVMKEEGTIDVTQDLIRNKRIAVQTEALSAEILRRMEQKSGYEKGTQAYKEAQDLIMKKISEILEEKNKPLV